MRQLADRFIQATAPDDDVKAIARVKGVVRPDGMIPPERVPVTFPWQSRDFHLPGVITMGANRGGILQFPQGGTIRWIAARARTAPSTGPAEFTVTVNGQVVSDTLRLSIPTGQRSADAAVSQPLPPMSDVALIVSASNGAADVTISLHVEPGVKSE